MRVASLVFFCVWSLISFPGAPERNVRGVVTDESAAVLPGVTIVTTAASGEVLRTTVSDSRGRYAITSLPLGTVTVTFQLEGFTTATVTVAVQPDADAIVNQRLVVASRSETVEVLGRIPLPPPPPPLPAPPPPRPRPVTVPVAEHDRDSVCGPARLEGPPESFGTIRSHRDAANGLYAKGDELVVDGGTGTGLAVGRNFAVRRTFRIGWDPWTETGEHTAGLVQILSADEHTSVAVVIYACDEMLPGDRLASARPEPLRPPDPVGMPDYQRAARILFPDNGQLLGAPGRMLVIDRGALFGIRAGQRLTLFRRSSSGGRAPSIHGDAVVVAVRENSATIRVEHVTDAVVEGDLAAPQGPSSRRRD